jgi:HlyD family secretion protein
MKMILALVALLVLAAVGWLAFSFRNAAPEVRFAEATTEDLVDTLNTNGKVEPLSWIALRAERGGKLADVRVQKGSAVAAGAVVATLENLELQRSLQAAEARFAQVEGEADNVMKGGNSALRSELDAGMSRLRVEITNAEAELAATERLVSRQAATPQEVGLMRGRLNLLREQMRGLEDRRDSLVSPGDRKAAEGRLKEAQSAVAIAKGKLEQGNVRSPIDGVVYQIDLRPGAIVNAGDLIANIGKVDALQVNVYVDEPELGRVAPGQAVTVTWDARQGKEWKGTVEKMPTQIVPLGSRQVGDVLVTIANPGNDLPPGANVNIAIRCRTAPKAVTIPKEALRRENGVTGVFVLDKEKVQWRPVETGIANVTRTQITRGLKSGERVALATDVPLRDGSAVKPASEEAAP